MTSLATAPDFTAIDPNSEEWRDARAAVTSILLSSEYRFGVYSHHSHAEVIVRPDQVIFEQWDQDNPKLVLKITPMDEEQARALGKPSCWGFLPGDDDQPEIVVLRYAEHALHESAGVDVTSPGFQDELRWMADAFVRDGIHTKFELNIMAGYLFTPPAGYMTREDTIGPNQQTVRFAEPPAHFASGDQRSAACWALDTKGELVVTGFCTRRH